MFLPNLRCNRSAANWMGVSGFLISCAMRRATSDQAARRWSANCWLMSSNVTTLPCARGETVTATVTGSGPSPSCTTPRALSLTKAANAGATKLNCCPTIVNDAFFRSFSAVELANSTTPLPSTDKTPAETDSRTASMNNRRSPS